MTAKRARDGVGGKAYRRQSQALKRKTQREGLRCVWCGEPIDTTLPSTHGRSFTMDHPVAIANGGHLTRQQGEPMHRDCNARKGDSQAVDLGDWSAT